MNKPELKNLPDPYLSPWEQDMADRAKSARHELLIRAADRAEIRRRSRVTLEDFERRLAERDRLDRITLAVCFALLVIVPAAVWWANS